MQINPFVGGLAIGGVGIAITILIANHAARRMADQYEARLIARDKRIQVLLGQIQELKAQHNREQVFRQIKKPLGR